MAKPTSPGSKSVSFVRTEDAPLLPPPASQAGVTGWLYQNIFASMSDFTSIAAAIRSLVVAFLTIVIVYAACE